MTVNHQRLGLPFVLLAAFACGPARGASDAELQRFRDARGELVRADTTFAGMRGRYSRFLVRLESDTRLVATGQLLVPSGAETQDDTSSQVVMPAVLLNDGRELDSRVLEYLPDEFGDIVVLSLDYPEELPYELELSGAMSDPDRLLQAAERVPAMFALGGAYLATRADVDRSRVAVAATSFAVPFAVIAAAADESFRNVALTYGAGDLASVLAANVRMRPAFLRSVAAKLAMRPFRSLEPERYVARVSPRPIVMVNGADDPQMPREAVEALYDAAREPKSLVWLRTGHLMPGDTALIRALVDTALARLPVLNVPQSGISPDQ